jgi:thiol-disulfide isomerase/thioredoxin
MTCQRERGTRTGLSGRTSRQRTTSNRLASLLVSGLLLLWSVTAPAGHPAKSAFSLLPEPRPLPAVEFIDAEGATHTLEDFRGRPVLLNVWATWCPPCREEMPALDRLQQTLGGTDFTVIALSIDGDGSAAVKRFFSDIKIQALTIYTDPWGDANGALRVVGLPTTLLIDRHGREIGRRVGPAEWDDETVVAEIRHYLDAQRTDGTRSDSPAATTTTRRP